MLRFVRQEPLLDDATRRHLDALEQRLDQRIDGVNTDLRGIEARLREKLETVGRGLEMAMSTAIDEGFRKAAEDRRYHHAETMRKLQDVIADAERIGAATGRDRRLAALEDAVSEVRERLDRVEKPRDPTAE